MIRHLAVIMDGNGRWAKSRHLPRTAGHKKGADAARAIIENCVKHKIEYLTLYAFSSENWRRPPDEVGELMNLFRFYMGKELKSLHEHGVRLRIIGDRSALSEDIQQQIADAEALTQDNTRLTLCIAMSYGSRQEITQAVKQMIVEGIAPEQVTEGLLEHYFYTAGIPEPDLLIRTGGEHRLSNYLLWQCAYTEFYFTDILWPDFDDTAFQNALEDFSRRERRFGASEAVMPGIKYEGGA